MFSFPGPVATINIMSCYKLARISRSGRPGFNPTPRHTKYFKNSDVFFSWAGCYQEHHVVRRCPWCNVYRRHEFKSPTRLVAFHIALIPLGKVWIQLFSPQLWINSRVDYSSALVRQLVYEKENSEFKAVKLRLKIDLVSYPARTEGLGK